MNRNIKVYRIIVISIAIILISVGIYVGINLTSKKENTNTATPVVKNNDNKQNQEVKIYTDPNDKIGDIELAYEDYYTLCGHTVIDSNIVYGISLNELKKDELKKQKEKNLNYDIAEEKENKLVFRRKLEQYCPNHFEVKIENSKVVIYNVVSQGVKTLYKNTDIEEQWVRPELIEELNKGVVVNSKEELNSLIEDIES
jgi:hypothetical protein